MRLLCFLRSDTSSSLWSRHGGNVATLLLRPERQIRGILTGRMTTLPLIPPAAGLGKERCFKSCVLWQPGHTQPANYVNTGRSWEDNEQRCIPSPFLMWPFCCVQAVCSTIHWFHHNLRPYPSTHVKANPLVMLKFFDCVYTLLVNGQAHPTAARADII